MYQQSTLVPAKDEGLFVRRLSLTRFRNYEHLRLDFPKNASRIVFFGQNGAGKTNLMEAISLLSVGKGLRHVRFSEMVAKGYKDFAVASTLINAGQEIDVGTAYTLTQASDRRISKINHNTCKNQTDLADVCSCVWITPAMDRLFSSDPMGRRRFLDRLTQSFTLSHAKNCNAYMHALRQWSKILKEGRYDEAWLSALEETLGRYGVLIASSRQQTLDFLIKQLCETDTAFPKPILSMTRAYDSSLGISDLFKSQRSSFAQKGTVEGVHTVDLTAVHQEKDMHASLCSTGEQKALLVSILLAYIQALKNIKGTLPLILLDEITAHLDADRRASLFAQIEPLKTQIFMTGTEPDLFAQLKQTAHFVSVESLLCDCFCAIAS